MIYTDTASVFDKVIRELTTAMDDSPQVTAVLLTCSDATARQRLSQREIGSELIWHIERSDLMARRLDTARPRLGPPRHHRQSHRRRHRNRGQSSHRLDQQTAQLIPDHDGGPGWHVITTSPFAPTAPSPAPPAARRRRSGPRAATASEPLRGGSFPGSNHLQEGNEVAIATPGGQRGGSFPGRNNTRAASDAPGRRPSRNMTPIRKGSRAQQPEPPDAHTTRFAISLGVNPRIHPAGPDQARPGALSQAAFRTSRNTSPRHPSPRTR